MKTIIIIPARYNSVRLPGKPLELVNGKQAIAWTYEAACRVKGVDEIYVATEDNRIKVAVEALGGKVLMTSETCRNGSERVAEAARLIGATNEDILINLQGDALLMPPWFVEELIQAIKENPAADMITPVLRCSMENYIRFTGDRKQGRVSAATVVFGEGHRALYFSKEVLPFVPVGGTMEEYPVFTHVGLYAYRLPALTAYLHAPVGPLERAEQMEQLRFLETGKQVFVLEVDARGHQFCELNNPEDVARIEQMMKENALLS